jgi:hypothetical protein
VCNCAGGGGGDSPHRGCMCRSSAGNLNPRKICTLLVLSPVYDTSCKEGSETAQAPTTLPQWDKTHGHHLRDTVIGVHDNAYDIKVMSKAVMLNGVAVSWTSKQ